MSAVRTEVGSVLDQLELRQPKTVLRVDGYQLPVTNLDKVLWPGGGRSKPLTKRDLLRYLTRVSPWLLPHLAGRPIFTTRYPDGVNGKSFYQKHWEKPPEYARTVRIYSSHNEGDGEYLICDNLPTLLFLVAGWQTVFGRRGLTTEPRDWLAAAPLAFFLALDVASVIAIVQVYRQV